MESSEETSTDNGSADDEVAGECCIKVLMAVCARLMSPRQPTRIWYEWARDRRTLAIS
jgi:hypothetical protein